MASDKVRFRFRKDGDLRLLSHHDLMRTCERLLRRAAIPFASTQGFHPQPRMVFASALSLGVIGHREVVEIETLTDCDPDDMRERMQRQAPLGLTFWLAERMPLSTTAQVCRAGYRLPIPSARADELRTACQRLLEQPHCWVERIHPQPRTLDIRRFVLDLAVRVDGLHLDLAVTPAGTARAEELLGVLGVRDLLMEGGILERLTLELTDETPTGREPVAVSAVCAESVPA